MRGSSARWSEAPTVHATVVLKEFALLRRWCTAQFRARAKHLLGFRRTWVEEGGAAIVERYQASVEGGIPKGRKEQPVVDVESLGIAGAG